MLPDLSLNITYRTGENDLLGGFYRPCLVNSVLYRRAVGYFTSSGLALASKGLANLVARGGKMQLIASPHLSDDDVDALERAKENPLKVLEQIAARSLKEVEDLLAEDRLNALAWLAASGALDVKLAMRVDKQGRFISSIYHEKIGIFFDEKSNYVAFNGSANETSGGLFQNFESITVFSSWDETEPYAKQISKYFELLWHDNSPGLKVLKFSDISRDLLKRYQKTRRPDPENEVFLDTPKSVINEDPASFIKPRQSLDLGNDRPLRSYQQEAINRWFEADCHGILAMATGSGKTLTALHALKRLADRGPLVAIIACPYINLAEQWVRELTDAGITNPVKAYGNKKKWYSQLQANFSSMHLGGLGFLPIVVVNRTFLSAEFQALLCPKKVPHLLIADEMHNLGAENLRMRLNPEIHYRLGLSATPQRHLDFEGTQALFDYFGNIVFTYDLRRAIEDRNLCRYYYYPILVQLTEEEQVQYEQISAEISRLMSIRDPDMPFPLNIKMKLLERARLLASAEGKIPALLAVIRKLKANNHPISNALVYCGDGRVDEPDEDDRFMRQIDVAARELGIAADLKIRRFTHSETPREREQILSDLRNRRLDALVAIRCLDEGIDLPNICMGFVLASSTNPRQFIQRRGRLLRNAPGKEYAEIWDFIVSPPDLTDLVDPETFNLERRLVAREMARVIEFCQTAINADSAEAVLLDLKRRYNLLAGI